MSSAGTVKVRKSRTGKRKKKKDPNAPKRPRSAYILYCTEKRNEVKNEHPDAKPADLMKMMGEMWNALSESKKKDFTDKAKEDKTRYNDQMKNYTPPDVESDEDDRPSKRQRGKKGKKKRDPNEPKRSPSAYLIYGSKIREEVKKDHPEAKSSEIMKIIGTMWQKLSEDEKKQYNVEAQVLKSKYEKDKQDYKNKKDAGNDDDLEDVGVLEDEEDEEDHPDEDDDDQDDDDE